VIKNGKLVLKEKQNFWFENQIFQFFGFSIDVQFNNHIVFHILIVIFEF